MSLPKTMRAAQLVVYKQPLEIREVPVPEPRGENVLIRIAGSGLCHSDLHIMGGEVLALARQGLLRSRIQRVRFEEINQTFDKLARGQIEGRAVLTPDR